MCKERVLFVQNQQKSDQNLTLHLSLCAHGCVGAGRQRKYVREVIKAPR